MAKTLGKSRISPGRTLPLLALSILGAGYFGTFSGLDLYVGFKPLAMLVPVQLGVLIYFLLWRRKKNSVEY